MRRRKRPALLEPFGVPPSPWQPRGWAPVWMAGGKAHTTCLGCNRLLLREHGPRCIPCEAAVQAPRRMRRRQRKLVAKGRGRAHALS